MNRQHHNEQELVNNINHFQSLLENTSKASANYNSYLSNINTWQKQLEETRNPPISLSELEQFVVRYHERKALFSKFDATRQANIKASRAAVSKEKLKQEENNERQAMQQPHYLKNTLLAIKHLRLMQNLHQLIITRQKRNKLKSGLTS